MCETYLLNRNHGILFAHKKPERGTRPAFEMDYVFFSLLQSAVLTTVLVYDSQFYTDILGTETTLVGVPAFTTTNRIVTITSIFLPFEASKKPS